MPGPPHGSEVGNPHLVGRSAEIEVLTSVVERGLRTGAALVVTGEPGVGKSVLLDAPARDAAASGATVLRAAGVEFEAGVNYAGLNQLLLPLLRDRGTIHDGQRDALLVALGLVRGPPPDRLLLSAAVLGLLTQAAQSRPVQIVLDDVPWLDRPSVEVLAFVARRLDGYRIGVLAAARTGSDCLLLQAGLPQLEVPPLDEDGADDLLRARFPTLPPSARQRVLSVSEGNPLALLELPGVITELQRTGAQALPPVLPLSSSLRRAFARELTTLPSTTRLLLLLTALEGSGDLRTLGAAAADDRWLDDLVPAEEAGLLHIDLRSERVTLRHPLIGWAAVELSTSDQRRRAHSALADVLVDRPEECAWHLTEATVGADERAADLLEMAARRARHNGDAGRAVTALLRSAELTPPGPDRARRLAAAAFVGTDSTGDLRSVRRLLSEARTADPRSTASLEVAVAAAHHLLNGEGDVETAHLMLVRAVEGALDHGSDAAALDDALHSLMLVGHFGGRESLWRSFSRALAAVGPGLAPVLAVAGDVFADPARAAPRALERLDELVASATASIDPAHIVRVGMAATYTDRLSACREPLRRVVRMGREGGAAASAVHALMMLSREAFDAGRWDEAEHTAEDGIAWGEQLGYRLITQAGVYCKALVAAARGEDGTAQALADGLVGWSARRGVCLFEHFAHRVRGLSALGRGDFGLAYQEVTAISPAGEFAPYTPLALSVPLDLVEAAVHIGRRDEAAAHVAAMAQADIFTSRPALALVSAGCAALVTSGTEASEGFERALAVPGGERYPFEHARIELLHGEHLRRIRATHASRVRLTAALETFDALGARPWASRARNELRATGLAPPVAPEQRKAGPLTSQEYQIAMLAASGLSNKEIGSRLYLSPRTIGAHLYRVFPKLGISSRAALRDALNDVAPGSRPPAVQAR